MKSFKDKEGRPWNVEINVTALKRVRDLCQVDLADAVGDDGKTIERITSDPVLLYNVLFVLCKPQADERKISDEDFGRAMAGDPIEDATNALLEELVDFFPKRRRTVFRHVLDLSRQAETRAMDQIETRLSNPALKAKLDKQVDEVLETVFGNLFGKQPESSE